MYVLIFTRKKTKNINIHTYKLLSVKIITKIPIILIKTIKRKTQRSYALL